MRATEHLFSEHQSVIELRPLCFAEWRLPAFDTPMTRQLSFAVDGVQESFLERCWRRLLKIAGGCGWQRLRGVAVARRHTKNCLLAVQGNSSLWLVVGRKQLVWVGELVRCRVELP